MKGWRKWIILLTLIGIFPLILLWNPENITSMLSNTEEAFLMLLVMIFYYFPSIIAHIRCKKDTMAIMALNLFLGWTLIGWVIALVWALKKD